jgi:hypothetical protein
MKQHINKSASNIQKLLSANLDESIQEKSLPLDDMPQSNMDLQQQARYLNRALEAYGDCV